MGALTVFLSTNRDCQFLPSFIVGFTGFKVVGGVVQSMRLVSRTHAACSRFIVACDRQTEWVGGRRGQTEEVSGDSLSDCLTLALFILKLVVAGRGGVGMDRHEHEWASAYE